MIRAVLVFYVAATGQLLEEPAADQFPTRTLCEAYGRVKEVERLELERINIKHACLDPVAVGDGE